MMKAVNENKSDVETAGRTITVTPPQETATHEANSSVIVGGYEVYNDSMLPYVGMFASSIVLLIALESGNGISDDKYYKYGLALASVTMVFSFVGYLMAQSNNVFVSYNNVFMFVWNFIGACIMTFGGPFKITGNGYFASWGIAIFAVMGLGVTASQIRNEIAGTLGSLMGLLTSSIILFVAIVSEGFDVSKSEAIYAIVIASLSIVIAAGLAARNDITNSSVDFGILGVLSILWIVAACLVTFRGPFLVTGNGYFSAWFGAVTAMFAAMAARRGNAATTSTTTTADSS